MNYKAILTYKERKVLKQKPLDFILNKNNNNFIKRNLYYNESNFRLINPYCKIHEIYYYNYNDYSSLAFDGWLKPCIACSKITSRTIIVMYKSIYTGNMKEYYRLYICKKCLCKYNDKLYERCRNKIKKYRRKK